MAAFSFRIGKRAVMLISALVPTDPSLWRHDDDG
jgi:hypothetical protein